MPETARLYLDSFIFLPAFLWRKSWRKQPWQILQSFTVFSDVWQHRWFHSKTGPRKVEDVIWPLSHLWAAFQWVWPAGPGSPIFPGTFWSRGRNSVAEISLFGRERSLHLTIYEFHKCFTTCHATKFSQISKLCRLCFTRLNITQSS